MLKKDPRLSSLLNKGKNWYAMKKIIYDRNYHYKIIIIYVFSKFIIIVCHNLITITIQWTILPVVTANLHSRLISKTMPICVRIPLSKYISLTWNMYYNSNALWKSRTTLKLLIPQNKKVRSLEGIDNGLSSSSIIIQ